MQMKKRTGYMLADVVAIVAAFSLVTLKFHFLLDLDELLPGHLYGCVLLICSYLAVSLFYQPRKAFMKRRLREELETVFIINFYMALCMGLLLWGSGWSARLVLPFYVRFFILNILIMLLMQISARLLILLYYRKPENRKRLLLCVCGEGAVEKAKKMAEMSLYDREVSAVAVFDEGGNGALKTAQNRGESSSEELSEYLKRQVVDEALLDLPGLAPASLNHLVKRLENMGIVVYVATDTFGIQEREKALERLGSYGVVTYCPRTFRDAELVLKRGMDLTGGLVGTVLTLFLAIFVAPAIYLESPGPIIFKQIRVGKNGRRFPIYKFRSMYVDAEERKKELMKQNEMEGLMFKMKDDPRITRVGRWLRKTSIDEFPQFLNVLKGDMSLVGTRPPTLDEFMHYEEHHKRRLSLKPGITGMWQVSGRSEIQDFEEIVRLDVKYIDNWSIWLDVKILIQTVLVVLRHKGAE